MTAPAVEPEEQPRATTVAPDAARAAGRGGIAIAGAKLYFILIGLVQQIVLKHVLGLEVYGALGRVQGVASILSNSLVTTGIQGVSRAVSGAAEAEREAAQRRAMHIHWLCSVPLAVGLFAGAPFITRVMNAPHLTLGMTIVSGLLLFYGLYAPLVGALNGKRRFGAQAGLDALAATLRTVGLFAGAYLFRSRALGMEGAFGGFVASAALMTIVALPLAGLGRAGAGGARPLAHLRFVAPLFAGQLALNLLMQADMQLLGRFAADAAESAGLDARNADTLAGAYRNAQLFCFLPYQLLLSVAFVLFPSLAAAQRDGDRAAIAGLVRGGVRVALVLAGLMVSVIAGLPGPLLALVFGADSAALGADAMTVLALGLGAFAIFGILSTVLTSLQREGTTALLTVVALLLVAGLCFATVAGRAFGPEMLLYTAGSTAIALLAATGVAAFAVRSVAGAVAPPLTLVRVLAGAAAAIAVARALPAPSKLLTLAYAPLCALVYLAVLALSRELGRDDLRLVRRVIR